MTRVLSQWPCKTIILVLFFLHSICIGSLLPKTEEDLPYDDLHLSNNEKLKTRGRLQDSYVDIIKKAERVRQGGRFSCSTVYKFKGSLATVNFKSSSVV